MWFFKRQPQLDSLVDFQEEWQSIKELLKTKRDSAMKQALLQADKLLDLALKNKKVQGETMGGRLKTAKTMFSKDLYPLIWQAHKLRNRLLHENEEILSFQIERAINTFYRALKELRYLK